MIRRINVNLFPPGGYYFTEQDGSSHRAGNWKSVIQKVRAYRARKGFHGGNVEEEVMAQACSRNPSLCFDATPRELVRPPITVKARILMWLNSISRSKGAGTPLSYVTGAEAAQRAAICATCPQNTPTGESDCSTCKQALASYRKDLVGSRQRDGRLGGCGLLGVDLMTAIHLDEIRIENPHLPANCWRKRGL